MPGPCWARPIAGYQEVLAKSIVAEGLTVRAIEETVRASTPARRARAGADLTVVEDDGASQRVAQALVRGRRCPLRRPRRPGAFRRPGMLELEELLSSHLNTRVKVDMSAKRGKVVVEFATLEDLERIYKLMVGELASTAESMGSNVTR